MVTKLLTEWGVVSDTLGNSEIMSLIYGAVGNSFSIAFIVTIIDIIVGIPMAWIFVRKNFKGKKYLDTLMDMPLAFPTAVLGISVVIFWGVPADGVTIPGLGLVVSPYMMMIMLHIIFTYPYMVRSLSAILEQIEPNYETAAMTLGASRFTAVRTITLPLFRAGLVTGFILCFARSLSETGGTYIALTLMGDETTFFTGPTFIAFMKEMDPSVALGPMIVISVIMIVLALILLLLVKRIMIRIKLPVTKVWPSIGRKLSNGIAPKLKDIVSIGFLMLVYCFRAFNIFDLRAAQLMSITPAAIITGMSFLVAGVPWCSNNIREYLFAVHRKARHYQMASCLTFGHILFSTTHWDSLWHVLEASVQADNIRSSW